MKITASHRRLPELRVAAIQYKSVLFDKIANFHNLERLTIEAARSGARLVVLPEMCTTGLSIADRKNASALAETIPGPTTGKFAALAAELGVWIVFGMIAKEDDPLRFYNSQVLISAQGRIAARYDKRNLYGPDWQWAEPGRGGYRAFGTEWGTIGLCICYDINFPDFWNWSITNDVAIVAFSTNWVEDRSPVALWETVARHTGAFFVAANNWGREGETIFSGESAVISPDTGRLVCSAAAGDSVVVADIRP